MKKIGLYYFSGTGNTEMAMSLFGDALTKMGHETTFVKIEDALKDKAETAIDTSSFDLIGIAYPVHAFNAPKPVIAFVRALQPINNKMAGTSDAPKDTRPTEYFILRTSGEPLSLNGGSSALLRSILRKKGYAINAEFGYVMPYNMIFRHSDELADLMLKTTSALVPIDAFKLHERTVRVSRIDPLRRFISFLFRVEHRAMEINGKHFRCGQSCNGCGKCARLCPFGNIRMVDGTPVFGNKCACCVRCSFHCPKNAIHIGLLNGWKINGKYPCSPLVNTTQNYTMHNIKISNDRKHKNYCSRSYVKYFERADAQIKEANEKNILSNRNILLEEKMSEPNIQAENGVTTEYVEKSLENIA